MSEPQDPYAGQPYGAPPPGYPPAGYPGQQPGQPAQPGYPVQPGYPAHAGYPGYPAYSPYPGYPPAPYGPYPYGTSQGLRRPGSATAAAVLGWVAAGLLILASLVLFSSASFANDLGNDFNADTGSITGELTIDGIVNLIAAGLLIAGGVMLAGRKTTGRTLFAVATAIVIIAGIYWIARATNYGGTVFFAMMYAALVVIGLSLAFTSTTREWLAATPASPAK